MSAGTSKSILTQATLLQPKSKKRSAPDAPHVPSLSDSEDNLNNNSNSSSTPNKKHKSSETESTASHEIEASSAPKPSNNSLGEAEMEMEDSDNEEYVTADSFNPLPGFSESELDEDRKLMMEMGFPVEFGSTKGKHVEGNDIYVAHKIKVRKVKQHVSKKGRPRGGGPPIKPPGKQY